MGPHELEQLAARLLAGELSIEEFVGRAGRPLTADVGDAQVDLDRVHRCGFPEVVFAEGKTVEAMAKIFSALLSHGADVLATRMTAGQAADLLVRFPAAHYNPVGRTFRIAKENSRFFECGDSSPLSPRVAALSETPNHLTESGDESPHSKGIPRRADSQSHEGGKVVIVTAGTSDLPVAEEARETALWTGAEVTLVQDVGVAGPHRLTANLPLLREADAVVVVAGMEGALPSVVGGYVACPVIAVPTSIGYGASFGGIAALLGMLNSCASNVTVVNIDAGFKGGYVAGLIARNVARARTNQGKKREH
jgi:pyridinium-3,5-biscarboxylic acid mononucleotide synthase